MKFSKLILSTLLVIGFISFSIVCIAQNKLSFCSLSVSVFDSLTLKWKEFTQPRKLNTTFSFLKDSFIVSDVKNYNGKETKDRYKWISKSKTPIQNSTSNKEVFYITYFCFPEENDKMIGILIYYDVENKPTRLLYYTNSIQMMFLDFKQNL